MAFAAVLAFSSCSNEDDPAGESGQEDKMLPVDSLVAMIEYDFSESAINNLEIKYEVTGFKGKEETFVVTDTGYCEKIYATTDLAAKANIKLTVTPKSALYDLEADSVYLKFMSVVSDGVYVKGKILTARPNNYYNPILEGTDIKSEFVSLCEQLAKEPYTYTIELHEAFKKGVSEEWFKEHFKD